MQAANVFTIAPGAPFLKTFASALLEGRVVEGFSKNLAPLAMADATIYVPTRRAARALAEELARAIGRPSMVLPRILPLGALEEAEASLFFDDAEFGSPCEPSIPQAAGEIERRMRLAQLILTWAQALRHAIVSVGAQGQREFDTREAFLVAATPADAWHLSGELANLIDELIIEDVAWAKLNPLVLPQFDDYWRITLDFLNIAIKEWPRMLAECKRVDKAWRQNALIGAHIGRLQDGAAGGPVIAIGSTGSHRATARLLAAIARAPKGAVVLPGLDQELDASAWAQIAGCFRKRWRGLVHASASRALPAPLAFSNCGAKTSSASARRRPIWPCAANSFRRLCVRRSRPANGWHFAKASMTTNLRPRCKTSV